MDLMQQLEPLRSQEPEMYANLQAVETRVFEMHVAPDTLEDPDAFAYFQEQQQALTDILGDVLGGVHLSIRELQPRKILPNRAHSVGGSCTRYK